MQGDTTVVLNSFISFQAVGRLMLCLVGGLPLYLLLSPRRKGWWRKTGDEATVLLTWEVVNLPTPVGPTSQRPSDRARGDTTSLAFRPLSPTRPSNALNATVTGRGEGRGQPTYSSGAYLSAAHQLDRGDAEPPALAFSLPCGRPMH